mmetsp:Transcript_26406/g.91834  ORF Transcript_26406/g.91834 Transcript_26406/m.91834 type:complete len:699 (+) Transcript_26406:965-3061(+)
MLGSRARGNDGARFRLDLDALHDSVRQPHGQHRRTRPAVKRKLAHDLVHSQRLPRVDEEADKPLALARVVLLHVGVREEGSIPVEIDGLALARHVLLRHVLLLLFLLVLGAPALVALLAVLLLLLVRFLLRLHGLHGLLLHALASPAAPAAPRRRSCRHVHRRPFEASVAGAGSLPHRRRRHRRRAPPTPRTEDEVAVGQLVGAVSPGHEADDRRRLLGHVAVRMLHVPLVHLAVPLLGQRLDVHERRHDAPLLARLALRPLDLVLRCRLLRTDAGQRAGLRRRSLRRQVLCRLRHARPPRPLRLRRRAVIKTGGAHPARPSAACSRCSQCQGALPRLFAARAARLSARAALLRRARIVAAHVVARRHARRGRPRLLGGAARRILRPPRVVLAEPLLREVARVYLHRHTPPLVTPVALHPIHLLRRQVRVRVGVGSASHAPAAAPRASAASSGAPTSAGTVARRRRRPQALLLLLLLALRRLLLRLALLLAAAARRHRLKLVRHLWHVARRVRRVPLVHGARPLRRQLVEVDLARQAPPLLTRRILALHPLQLVAVHPVLARHEPLRLLARALRAPARRPCRQLVLLGYPACGLGAAALAAHARATCGARGAVSTRRRRRRPAAVATGVGGPASRPFARTGASATPTSAGRGTLAVAAVAALARSFVCDAAAAALGAPLSAIDAVAAATAATTRITTA